MSPPCQQIIWNACQKKAFPAISLQKSAWSLVNATGTLSGTVFYGHMRRRCRFSATNTQGWFGVKRRMPIPKII